MYMITILLVKGTCNVYIKIIKSVDTYSFVTECCTSELVCLVRSCVMHGHFVSTALFACVKRENVCD